MIPSLDQLNSFIETNLSHKLELLNKQRKKSLFASFQGCISIILVMSVTVGVNFVTLNSPNHTQILIGSFAGVFLLLMGYAFYVRKNSVVDFESTFKEEVIKPLISFINKDFIYKPDSYISHNEFLKTGFFENQLYNYDGNDQLIGKHNDVLFQFCDLQVTKTPSIKTPYAE